MWHASHLVSFSPCRVAAYRSGNPLRRRQNHKGTTSLIFLWYFFLDFLNFSLSLCLHMNFFTMASSSEKWFRASSLISEWLAVVQTGGTLIKAIVKGGYKYSLSLTPTDRCTVTVRLHVTSTCSCIQRKSCAASGGVLLCSLVKDAEKHRHLPLTDFHSSFLLNFVFDVHKRLFYGCVRINIIKLCSNEL